MSFDLIIFHLRIIYFFLFLLSDARNHPNHLHQVELWSKLFDVETKSNFTRIYDLLQDIDDNRYKLERIVTSGYQHVFYYITVSSVCKALKYRNMLWEIEVQPWNMQCPIPTERYEVINFRFHVSLLINYYLVTMGSILRWAEKKDRFVEQMFRWEFSRKICLMLLKVLRKQNWILFKNPRTNQTKHISHKSQSNYIRIDDKYQYIKSP